MSGEDIINIEKGKDIFSFIEDDRKCDEYGI